MKRMAYWVILSMICPAIVWAGNGSSNRGTPACCLDSTVAITQDSTVAKQPAAVRAIHKVIGNVIDSLLALAGPIAVLMVLYAAFLLITAAANEGRIKRAWTTILYVVFGLVILALAKDLVSLVRSILGK